MHYYEYHKLFLYLSRKKVLLALLLLGLVSAAGLLALRASLQGLMAVADTDPDAALSQLRTVLHVFTAATAVASVFLAAWFTSLAGKTLRSGRYPPPGVRVLRDTGLRTGAAARRMAIGLILAALVVLATNLVTGYLYRILDQVQG